MGAICSCVRSNKSLGINNMEDLDKNRRNGLGLGLIADLTSADKDCKRCLGYGNFSTTLWVVKDRLEEAEDVIKQFIEWFGETDFSRKYMSNRNPK